MGGAQRFSKYLLKVNNLSLNATAGQIVARADYTSKLIPNMRKLYLMKKEPELFEQPKPVPAAQPKNACKKCAGPTLLNNLLNFSPFLWISLLKRVESATIPRPKAGFCLYCLKKWAVANNTMKFRIYFMAIHWRL